MKKLGLLLLAGALVAGGVPALALDAGVGGVGVSAGSGANGGTSATGSAGNTSGTVSIGNGNTASATIGTGQSQVTGNINNTGTQPGVSVTQGNNATDAAVTLGLSQTGLNGTTNGAAGTIGGLLDGINIGTQTPTPGTIGTDFAGLSRDDQRQLLDRCSRILMSPNGFDRDVIALCRKLASL